MVGEYCRFGILTASDRASSGEYKDLSGPSIEDFLRETLTSPWGVERMVVPDEKDTISSSIIELA
ncbi:MAG TPA: molybdopterin adenylyltransferase, partial [Candidatus Poseidoniales archaeon]